MFDIFSWQHLSIMLIVALVVVGPKDLPRLMNMAGKWAGKARTMAGEFRRSFDEMARESELAELRKEIDNLKKNNPITEVANTMSGVQAEIGNPMEGAGIAAGPSEAAAPAAAEPRSGEFQVTESEPRPAPATPSSQQV
jgi:sec-independent protein translocase protein TatB